MEYGPRPWRATANPTSRGATTLTLVPMHGSARRLLLPASPLPMREMPGPMLGTRERPGLHGTGQPRAEGVKDNTRPRSVRAGTVTAINAPLQGSVSLAGRRVECCAALHHRWLCRSRHGGQRLISFTVMVGGWVRLLALDPYPVRYRFLQDRVAEKKTQQRRTLPAPLSKRKSSHPLF